ncbi:MAG TPA: aminopeptidase, partial [Candidatus Limnocylindrales bacterium]|nr:aminopeptidase [Candidatus Limnocylindrales bacterium]
MVTVAERLERLADLVVRVGANVQSGQDVEIRGLVEHAPIARAVAEHAYAAGARRVVVRSVDNVVQRAAIVHAPLEALSSHYDYEALHLTYLRRPSHRALGRWRCDLPG